MPRFAHIADCHLGAWRDKRLREANLLAFESAMDACIREKVDFILIVGDLFHTNIPDMSVTDKAVKKMRQVTEKGIPIYLIYGSHDYSPNSSSIIDILHSSGLFTKVSVSEQSGGKLIPRFTTDPRTKAKITGISARVMGLERKYYELLDHEAASREEGFKIFAFHTAIKEIRPPYLSEMEGMPASMLPPGIDYYAGGHIHERIEEEVDGRTLNYPGPLMGYNFSDLERSAQGADRGFFIVDFGDGKTSKRYIPIVTKDTIFREFAGDGKTAEQLADEISTSLSETDVRDAIVLLRMKGKLSSGKPSDVGFHRIRDNIKKRGAFVVHINRYGLSSSTHSKIQIMGKTRKEIERKLFAENADRLDTFHDSLKAAKGRELGIGLLECLRSEKVLSETRKGYEERISREALAIMERGGKDED